MAPAAAAEKTVRMEVAQAGWHRPVSQGPLSVQRTGLGLSRLRRQQLQEHV